MAQIFPQLPEINTSVAGSTEDKVDSVVRQLNEQIRLLNTAYSQFKNESYIDMNEWFGSYKKTPLDTWITLNGSRVFVNFDDWEYHAWYWENIIFTDGGTGYVRLYNVTDGEAVPGTEYSTTAPDEDNPDYNRTDVLTKYRGTKEFVTQVKISGGDGTTENVNCMKSRMVFRISS